MAVKQFSYERARLDQIGVEAKRLGLSAPKQQRFNQIARQHQRLMDEKWMAENAGRDIHVRQEMYPYIPYPLEPFFQLVKPFVKPGMRVIDVGCGAGDKLHAFRKLGRTLQLTGLEYDSELAATAAVMCPFARIVLGDARLHDYSGYDLVYMYQPMSSSEGQADLQVRMMQTMRIGATLVAALHYWVNPRNARKFPNFREGWTKTKPYDEQDYVVDAWTAQDIVRRATADTEKQTRRS